MNMNMMLHFFFAYGIYKEFVGFQTKHRFKCQEGSKFQSFLGMS